MRYAAILGTLDEHALSPIEQYLAHTLGAGWMDIATGAARPGCVAPVKDGIYPLTVATGRQWDLYSTLWIGPHTDRVVHDYTMGIVLGGSHWLFTGAGRKVGVLERGAAFVLRNKSLHGAAQTQSGGAPLIFVTADFQAYDMRHAHGVAVDSFDQLNDGASNDGVNS